MSMNQNSNFNLKDGNNSGNSILHLITLQLGQATSNTALSVATKSVVDASVLAANVGQVFGLEARAIVQNQAVINGTLAPVHAVLDITNNANAVGANGAYCIVCEDNTDSNANTTRGAGFGGANVTTAANATVIFSTNNVTNSIGSLPTSNNGGALRVRVNGATRWIQLSTGLNS
jgi:hypothetical protein